MNQLVFLTGNAGKFREAEYAFQKEIKTISLKQDSSPLLELQSDNLEEVARFKLKSFIDKQGPQVSSCFTEDAGFFVAPHLKGFPGVYSAYVQKVIGNSAIIKLMQGIKDRRCYFGACIAFYSQQTQEIHCFSGKVEGLVSEEERGTGGFGFDPIFIPNENPSKTFAELSAPEKNAISHRGRALASFIEFLKQHPDLI